MIVNYNSKVIFSSNFLVSETLDSKLTQSYSLYKIGQRNQKQKLSRHFITSPAHISNVYTDSSLTTRNFAGFRLKVSSQIF